MHITIKPIPLLFASAFAYSAAVHFDPALHVHPEMPAPVWPDYTVASISASGATGTPLVTSTTNANQSAAPSVYVVPLALEIMPQAGDMTASGEGPPTETG